MSIIISSCWSKRSLRAKSHSRLLLPVDVVTGRMCETQSGPTPQGDTLSPYREGDIQDTTLVCNHHLVSAMNETLL